MEIETVSYIAVVKFHFHFHYEILKLIYFKNAGDNNRPRAQDTTYMTPHEGSIDQK